MFEMEVLKKIVKEQSSCYDSATGKPRSPEEALLLAVVISALDDLPLFVQKIPPPLEARTTQEEEEVAQFYKLINDIRKENKTNNEIKKAIKNIEKPLRIKKENQYSSRISLIREVRGVARSAYDFLFTEGLEHYSDHIGIDAGWLRDKVKIYMIKFMPCCFNT